MVFSQGFVSGFCVAVFYTLSVFGYNLGVYQADRVVSKYVAIIKSSLLGSQYYAGPLIAYPANIIPLIWKQIVQFRYKKPCLFFGKSCYFFVHCRICFLRHKSTKLF